MKHENEPEQVEENVYEEPSIEDFLFEEDDEKVQKPIIRPIFIKIIVVLISLSLLSSIFGVWIKVFNLPSFDFLERSSVLSKEEMIQEYKQAVVTIEGNGVKGTGFNISIDGLIITNSHVIDGMNQIVVSFPNGDFYKGDVVLDEKEIDIAIVNISPEQELPYLPLAEKQKGKWNISDRVYIIGNPLAYTRIAIDGKIVSEEPNGSIKIEAPIHKGNSGSPVINEDGMVIGVIYAKSIPKVGKEDLVQGFATPIEQFSKYLTEDRTP
ncbi:S1 family peptidase [Litchfieldia salsa]|uniref:Trypsin-like peptidase domain-containing protein n=1 Tax=Litchfieldia salsa TaxID=930152 RepID=A0A1H0RMY4_9BACI|nr:serine protease [Litchfieldia salsa]SDP30854.1 Trypsin-like peptidase domain-containing protein [Litchfieldia salsa]